jgi:hypothetical protein
MQQRLGHFFRIGACFPLAGGPCKLYANAEEKMLNTAPTFLSATQAASQSTFINTHK